MRDTEVKPLFCTVRIQLNPKLSVSLCVVKTLTELRLRLPRRREKSRYNKVSATENPFWVSDEDALRSR